MSELIWAGEVPYHVARPSKGTHYSIELVEGPVSYFELRGTHVFPWKKFLTLAEAKDEAQRHYNSAIRALKSGGAK